MSQFKAKHFTACPKHSDAIRPQVVMLSDIARRAGVNVSTVRHLEQVALKKKALSSSSLKTAH